MIQRNAMLTEILSIDSRDPERSILERAAEVLRNGGTVAFPTETVYGLGANALDVDAVGKIFTAKGRAPSNPIIVHVNNLDAARGLAKNWSPKAQQLGESFWPGGLTLVVPKTAAVPDIVTAGNPTVGLRVPSHPVALALLEAADMPIAAPSANRSNHLSPTTAEHVCRDLQGHIDLILDGGPAYGGLESTVLDMTVTPPRLLRPGLIAPTEIEAVIGPIQRGIETIEESPKKSPGMLQKHYAPRAPLECVANDNWQHVKGLLDKGLRIGWLTFATEPKRHPCLVRKQAPSDSAAYAAMFYAALHEMDAAGVEHIIVDWPPQTDEWLAVRDRLKRAAWRQDSDPADSASVPATSRPPACPAETEKAKCANAE